MGHAPSPVPNDVDEAPALPRLVRVHLEYDLVVSLAEDDDDYNAIREAQDAVDGEEPTFKTVDDVYGPRDLPPNWDSALPYGDPSEDRTCGEIAREIEARVTARATADHPLQARFPWPEAGVLPENRKWWQAQEDRDKIRRTAR